MTSSVAYRWDLETFLRAQEAQVFTTRVELVEGEVWPVSIGDWHGRTTVRVIAALLPHGDPTQASLPSAGSLPDPDVWLPRPGARPAGSVSPRLSRWDAADVLLVVEVSDETLEQDLTTKADLYARSGYDRYWVVARGGVHEHRGATPAGYEQVRLLPPGERVALPGGHQVAVAALLPPG